VFSPLIDSLINHLRFLPGIGPKSAQRMAFHILERGRSEGLALAKSLETAIEEIGHCQRCRTLSELSLCQLCANPDRDNQLLCVVETPIDIIAIEQTHAYKGYYFVLMGHLSPLDGIGPAELGIQDFLAHLGKQPPEEVILATSSTVEGETTAHYLSELLKTKPIRISRLAHGIPLGNELEFIDHNTLMNALIDRKPMIDLDA
jgi:recombination protein RecR